MSSPKIVQAKNFIPENVVFNTPMLNKKGVWAIYINYKYDDNSVSALRIQMPKLKTPFGISAFLDQQSLTDGPVRNSKDSIQLSFTESEADSDIVAKFEKLDKMVLELGLKHSLDFLGQDPEEDGAAIVIKKALISTIKHSVDKKTRKRDNKYPPTFKANLFKDDGVYRHKFYKQGDRPGTENTKVSVENCIDFLPKMSSVVSIVKCSSVWVVSGKFGLSWIPEQIKVYKSDTSLTQYSFVDDPEDEEETEQVEELESPFDNLKINTQSVEETDLFEAEDDLDEIVEETPKKASSRRKKA